MPTPPFTRRRFLRQAALAGSASTLAMPLIARGVAANDRIRVALIGAGVRGRAHLSSLIGRADVEVVAVADVDEKHRQAAIRLLQEASPEKASAAKSYVDFRELIAAGGVDAAVIAVPNHWHALIAIACAKAGMDMYGEVPLAHTVVEGRAVCRAVARYGRVWQSGNQLRSDPFFQRACGYVASGRLGVTRAVEVGTYGGFVDRTGASKEAFFQSAEGLDYDSWIGPARWLPYHPGRVHENWRWHLAFGGGQLMSWVGKYVDVALWALGLDRGGPKRVEATGTFAQHAIYDVPVRYDVEAQFFNNLRLQVSSSYAPGIRWHGDNGWIYVSEGQLLASSPDFLENDGESDWAFEAFSDHGQDHWGDFIASMRTRRPTVGTCESAQRAATVGHLGLIALNVGRPLVWKAEDESIVEDRTASEQLEVPYREPWMLED